MAPKLRGIKQKKLIIHPLSSMPFLLFYSPKPRSQVRILIYRNWAIGDKGKELVCFMNDWSGGLVEIFAKLAPETLQDQLGGGFAS